MRKSRKVVIDAAKAHWSLKGLRKDERKRSKNALLRYYQRHASTQTYIGGVMAEMGIQRGKTLSFSGRHGCEVFRNVMVNRDFGMT